MEPHKNIGVVATRYTYVQCTRLCYASTLCKALCTIPYCASGQKFFILFPKICCDDVDGAPPPTGWSYFVRTTYAPTTVSCAFHIQQAREEFARVFFKNMHTNQSLDYGHFLNAKTHVSPYYNPFFTLKILHHPPLFDNETTICCRMMGRFGTTTGHN